MNKQKAVLKLVWWGPRAFQILRVTLNKSFVEDDSLTEIPACALPSPCDHLVGNRRTFIKVPLVPFEVFWMLLDSIFNSDLDRLADLKKLNYLFIIIILLFNRLNRPNFSYISIALCSFETDYWSFKSLFESYFATTALVVSPSIT